MRVHGKILLLKVTRPMSHRIAAPSSLNNNETVAPYGLASFYTKSDTSQACYLYISLIKKNQHYEKVIFIAIACFFYY